MGYGYTKIGEIGIYRDEHGAISSEINMDENAGWEDLLCFARRKAELLGIIIDAYLDLVTESLEHLHGNFDKKLFLQEFTRNLNDILGFKVGVK